jgi:malonyl-CoA reductase/3-hydroxypropionate dehydrogenase (NADP+)
MHLAKASRSNSERVKGIRVNTLFPGPIESERIESVFARMDELQGVEPGSTGKEFRDLMITTRTVGRWS